MTAFADYINNTKQQLKAERIAHHLPYDDKVIEMNAPFELLPKLPKNHVGTDHSVRSRCEATSLRATRSNLTQSKSSATGEIAASTSPPRNDSKKTQYQNGVLLVHGFLDSPYTLRSVAKIYQSQGFLVRCILLPGHGASPQALHKIKIKHWQKTIDNGIKALQADCENIHLCGFSLGGALCYLALKKHMIASLCLLAPAFEISNITAITLPFVTKVSKKKWFSKLQWVAIKGQPYNHVRYNAFPLQTAEYVNQIVKKAQKCLRHSPISCPLFAAITLEDETVRFHSIYKAFKRATNPIKQAICFTRKKFVFKRPNIQFITMKNSHIGLAVSPDDQYLGKTATQNATTEDLHFHRLTYNPRFDALEKSLSQFLEQLI